MVDSVQGKEEKWGAKDDYRASGPLGGWWFLFRGRDFVRPQVGWFETNPLVWGWLNLRCLWDIEWRGHIDRRTWSKPVVQKRGLSFINNQLPLKHKSWICLHILLSSCNCYLGFISFSLSLSFSLENFFFLPSPLLWFVCLFWLRAFLPSSAPSVGHVPRLCRLPPGSPRGVTSGETEAKGTAVTSHLEIIRMWETGCYFGWGQVSSAEDMSCCWDAFWKAHLTVWAQDGPLWGGMCCWTDSSSQRVYRRGWRGGAGRRGEGLRQRVCFQRVQNT